MECDGSKMGLLHARQILYLLYYNSLLILSYYLTQDQCYKNRNKVWRTLCPLSFSKFKLGVLNRTCGFLCFPLLSVLVCFIYLSLETFDLFNLLFYHWLFHCLLVSLLSLSTVGLCLPHYLREVCPGEEKLLQKPKVAWRLGAGGGHLLIH